jgi:hypothetical protein
VTGSLQGEVIRKAGMVQGWCWSPARPTDRLQVALLIDGARLAVTRAGRLRSEIVRAGICDGYHGFSLALPADLSATARIEMQECDSGRIFGRLVPYETAESRVWRAEAERAYASAAALQEGLSASSGQPRWAALAPALGEMGRQFAGAPVPAPYRPGGLRLTAVARPRVSLLLDTGFDATGAADSIGAVAPVLKHYQAELLVSDDGCRTVSASLAALPGLGLCFTRAVPGAARANDAAKRARGEILVFLRAGGVTSRGLAELLDAAQGDTAAGAPAILIGGLAQVNAQQAGLGHVVPRVEGDTMRSGLSLLVPSAVFLTLGGFDPAMEDGADLPVLDFALRAQGAGHAVFAWRDSLPAALDPLPQAAAARECFARQLNDRPRLGCH